MVEFKMQIRLLPNCSDTLLMQRSASIWMKMLKHRLAVTVDPYSLLHVRVQKSPRPNLVDFRDFGGLPCNTMGPEYGKATRTLSTDAFLCTMVRPDSSYFPFEIHKY